MASGGKSSGNTSSQLGQTLGNIAIEINKEVDPVRRMFLHQLRQVLRGNLTTGSSLPLIQSGVRSARDAGGASLADTERYLASSGAARSPFASAIESMTAQGTEQQIAAIPSEVAAGYVGLAPATITGIGGQALTGLANAAQTNYNTSSANENFSLFTSLIG